MKASYTIQNTPEHLVRIGTDKYYVNFICGGETDWEHSRRTKNFYPTAKEAEAAGKRYLKKMQKNGFDI